MKNSHITQFLSSFLSDVSILGHLYSTGLDPLTLDLSFDKWTLRTFCCGFWDSQFRVVMTASLLTRYKFTQRKPISNRNLVNMLSPQSAAPPPPGLFPKLGYSDYRTPLTVHVVTGCLPFDDHVSAWGGEDAEDSAELFTSWEMPGSEEDKKCICVRLENQGLKVAMTSQLMSS